jgi:hypothetical protein
MPLIQLKREVNAVFLSLSEGRTRREMHGIKALEAL